MDEQIAFALRQRESGTVVSAWPRLGRLKQLEEEKRKLKQLVADLRLDKRMLRTCFQNSFKARPEARSQSSWE